MELALSDSQQMLQELTRKFIESNASIAHTRRLLRDSRPFDPEVWAPAAAAGWASMLGGDIGSEDFHLVELGIIARELGRTLFPTPTISTNLAAYLLARGGSDIARESYLPGLLDGSLIGAMQWLPRTAGCMPEGVEIDATPTGYRVSGRVKGIADAEFADVLVVTIDASGGITQLVLPASGSGVTIRTMSSLDVTRSFSEVVLDEVDVPASAVIGSPGQGEGLLTEQETLAAALLCSETVGAAERAYEMTVEYVRDRKVFGRALGSFQAIKHRLADMLLWLEGSRAATMGALSQITEGSDGVEYSSVASAYVSERTPMIVRECLQMHGGIGCTWEHDIHLYLRRVESNAILIGGSVSHYDRIADLLDV
jgi:alkylation response protein AidB-like acyl-CoA dehydrogenase